MSSLPHSRALRSAVLFALLLVLSRLIVLVLITVVVDGREFSDDVDNHLEMARQPLGILLTEFRRHLQHPPLLPLAEALLVWPLSALLPDFLVFRVTVILYEGLAALFLALAASGLSLTARERRAAAIAFLLLPSGWVTTAVFGQDEAIATAFLACTLWFSSRRQHKLAALSCGLGICAGKVFLAVPLLFLVVHPTSENRLRRAALGFGPPVALQAWMLLRSSVIVDRTTPLLSFAPEAPFGVNIGPLATDLFGWSPDQARFWTGMACLLAVMVLLIAESRSPSGPLDPRQVFALAGAALSLVLAFFYHVRSDYYLLLSPLVLLSFPRLPQIVSLSVLTTSAWGGNLCYAVARSQTSDLVPAKLALVAIYDRLVPIPATTLRPLLAVLTTSMAALLAAQLIRSARRRNHERSPAL